MASLIPQAFIEELVARTDIVELVSGYVKLTKRTGANDFGLCPFHNEKSPSFSVNREKQMYYCFGCHHGGSAIHFIQEIENLPYRDAIEFLARRAGMIVPQSEENKAAVSLRNRLLDLNRDAARFFHESLASPKGAAAVRYIEKRGITKEMVRRFGLGAAADTWDTLTNAMTARGYTREELVAAGLARRGKTSGVYDYFRDRLMFPVIDVRGSVIGFSGRALGEGEPKYLNTPDTPVFSKSHHLFALNLAKKTKAGMLILAEGNIDVVSLHQAGLDCAVASLGTSLTKEQVNLMKQFTKNLVIAYDADDAGQKAAQRAITLLENTDISVRVLRVTGAKDPDEFIKAYGADAFRVLLDKCENHIEYRLRVVLSKSNLDTEDGRVSYLREAVQVLAELHNAPEREIYGRKVAEAAGIGYDSVASEVRKTVRARVKAGLKREQRQEERPRTSIQPEDRSLRYENEYSASAEQGVLQSLMRDPELFRLARAENLHTEEFTSPLLGKVYGILLDADGNGTRTTPALLTAELPPAEASQITRILAAPFAPTEPERALRDYIEKIRREGISRETDITAALLAVQRNKQRKVLG